jgi:RNA polymerase sigma-70 factor (ECF subfamily)
MDHRPPSDAEMPALTRAMRRHDEQAWRRFHDSYYNLLFRAALDRGVPESEAPDVVQRTYLRIMRHLRPFAEEAGFRAWICCLLRSEAIDAARGRARRQTLLERFRNLARGNSCEARPGWEDPLAGCVAPDLRLLQRYHIEGWSHAELAAEVGISPKAMESKLARLRQRARAWLAARGETTP